MFPRSFIFILYSYQHTMHYADITSIFLPSELWRSSSGFVFRYDRLLSFSFLYCQNIHFCYFPPEPVSSVSSSLLVLLLLCLSVSSILYWLPCLRCQKEVSFFFFLSFLYLRCSRRVNCYFLVCLYCFSWTENILRKLSSFLSISVRFLFSLRCLCWIKRSLSDYCVVVSLCERTFDL